MTTAPPGMPVFPTTPAAHGARRAGAAADTDAHTCSALILSPDSGGPLLLAPVPAIGSPSGSLACLENDA